MPNRVADAEKTNRSSWLGKNHPTGLLPSLFQRRLSMHQSTARNPPLAAYQLIHEGNNISSTERAKHLGGRVWAAAAGRKRWLLIQRSL